MLIIGLCYLCLHSFVTFCYLFYFQFATSCENIMSLKIFFSKTWNIKELFKTCHRKRYLLNLYWQTCIKTKFISLTLIVNLAGWLWTISCKAEDQISEDSQHVKGVCSSDRLFEQTINHLLHSVFYK
jgi:hypothetical protein